MSRVKVVLLTKIDANGNNCISVVGDGFRGFSIQTNGNLEVGHRRLMHKESVHTPEVLEEIKKFVVAHGTARQRRLMSGAELSPYPINGNAP